jgi:Family of unknown function (DUF6492)
VTTSIFIKSWPPDYGFLSYCLKSIHRYAKGFSEVVVLIPDDSDLPLTQERLVKVHDPVSNGKTMHGQGYVRQQLYKVRADKYCNSDMVCMMDSDCVFTRPVTPDDLMVDGKPLWLMTPFSDILPTDKNLYAHQESIKAFSGIEPQYEYMRRHSQVIPKWAFGCFRDYVQERHGMSFEQWALAQPFRGVTEFNFIGQFLHREFPNFIHFHDTRFGIPESFVKQWWSWSGLTPQVRLEIEAILA